MLESVCALSAFGLWHSGPSAVSVMSSSVPHVHPHYRAWDVGKGFKKKKTDVL